MGFPENPNTIVLKNSYYPNGLTEEQIWKYYQTTKQHILRETIARDLMLVIFVDLNKPIIRRKGTKGYIQLTPANYDNVMTGRTVSIHSSMKQYEQYGIIDIDIDPRDGFHWARRTTNDVYDFVMDKMPVVKEAKIRFTGKTSFHIVCDFGRKIKVDTMKFLLEKFLRESPLSKVYTINAKKATSGVPNLDLNRNCFRCNYITLHSLSEVGLRCMEVSYSELLSFNPRKALI